MKDRRPGSFFGLFKADPAGWQNAAAKKELGTVKKSSPYHDYNQSLCSNGVEVIESKIGGTVVGRRKNRGKIDRVPSARLLSQTHHGARSNPAGANRRETNEVREVLVIHLGIPASRPSGTRPERNPLCCRQEKD